jgi:hypothetical protein
VAVVAEAGATTTAEAGDRRLIPTKKPRAERNCVTSVGPMERSVIGPSKCVTPLVSL